MFSSKRLILKSVLACACLAVVLIIALGSYSVSKSGSNKSAPSPTPVRISSHSSCGSTSQALCTEETTLSRYVSVDDYSDILENQTPVDVLCNGSTKLQSYCQGGISNLRIQLYTIIQDQKSQYMTRNQFITFLMSYAGQYGPFTYVKTVASGASATMSFDNHANTNFLTLTLADPGSGGWKVAYPSVGVE